MSSRRSNHRRPVTETVLKEVKRLHKQGFSAKEIAYRVGRSEVAIYNMFRLFDLKRGNGYT